jgi:hypothetical protein
MGFSERAFLLRGLWGDNDAPLFPPAPLDPPGERCTPPPDDPSDVEAQALARLARKVGAA